MTDKDIQVELEKRTVLGKGLQGLRKEGRVPVVMHDHGKESLHLSGAYTDLAKAYSDAGKHHAVQLVFDGQQHLAIIKDVHIEQVKHRGTNCTSWGRSRREEEFDDPPPA